MSASGPENLARAFYDAFARRDANSMNVLYSENASFADPIFPKLNAQETRAMWAMLCESAKDFSLNYEIKEVGTDFVVVSWLAKYAFGPSGRRVENSVSARLLFRDGKIIEHKDVFDFYRWARQAFGIAGIVLGGFSFFQFKVQTTARGNLDKYIRRQAR